MITVAIMINGNPLVARSATNTRKQYFENSSFIRYAVDDGTEVIHNPADGAVALAHKLLDCIKEYKHPRDEASNGS